VNDSQPSSYVSTGALPTADAVSALLADAHARYRQERGGAISSTYPALATVSPDLFGICVSSTGGRIFEVGDAGTEFTVMSVAKPFVFALVSAALGVDHVRTSVGVNATGQPFNSIAAVERDPIGRTNPMVNSGALATTALAPGGSTEDKWAFLLDGLSRFAGRELALDRAVYASAVATNHRNQAIAALLQSLGGIAEDARAVTELYTRQSCLRVSAVDLAVMGATLADGGVNPRTGVTVVDPDVARATLAVMTIAGLYETSGDWLLDVGLPGKSGIGGGIVTVSPGKGGLGTYAPLLDAAGNSVKGQLATAYLARRLGLDILASQPAETR
jgi:glutaminase